MYYSYYKDNYLRDLIHLLFLEFQNNAYINYVRHIIILVHVHHIIFFV